MAELILFIESHLNHAPIIIFGTLLLAGFNIPVSEDGMLFISATLAAKNPELWLNFFLAVYLGAYFSDLICYSLGRFLGPKILRLRLFSGIARQSRIDKIHDYYQRYGIITLVLGRFIPFGIRNGLFLTAGLGKMNAVKFAASDLLACTLSTVTFFSLYYRYSTTVIEYVKEFNMGIFILALGLFGYFLLRKRSRESKQ